MASKLGLIILSVITLSSVTSTNYTPSFNESLEVIRVVAGQTAVLPCYARYKGDHTVIWMNPQRTLFSKEKLIVIEDRRLSIETSEDGDWNLKIEHVQHNDSGEYMCTINTSPVKIKRVRLHVQVPAHILNKGSSRDTDVKEGHDLTLSCKATGIPRPNITWFMKPLEAKESKEYLNAVGETLHIRNIQRFQSGEYVCVAYNGVPRADTREMLVQVQYEPIVKLLNTRLGQSRGKETILECSVTSYPRANIRWLKNGAVITHGFKHRLELYSRKHNTVTLTLEIVFIDRDDYGEYICEAKNLLGSRRASMVLYEYKEPTTTTEVMTTPFIRTTTYDYRGMIINGNKKNKKNGRPYKVLTDSSSLADFSSNARSAGMRNVTDFAFLYAAFLLKIMTSLFL